MIDFVSEDVDLPLFSNSKILEWINKIIKNNNCTAGDITYIFCSDNYLLEINRKYLNHDYYTDIITFNYNENKLISGDIFISVDTVFKNSKEYHTNFEMELFRVMIHGILHLIGFEDQTDEQQDEMTRQEDQALRLLPL